MSSVEARVSPGHSHVFLGEAHEHNERRDDGAEDRRRPMVRLPRPGGRRRRPIGRPASLGPGHLGAILSVLSATGRDARYYRGFATLAHITVKVLTRRNDWPYRSAGL
ncbi:hypothetical protein [Acidocella aromatica]|uniref:Uncharacterized protein n=1 Tax=Acidocella aromatica TaxID=1303579 RepID=A0A840VC89_9PROT|nr:hypothetical protein [Acidocella aromatica]MBB5373254.1 hypothetical protein [Acidocella aromatica]